MGRLVWTNQDRAGQTLDASALPDGHARRSYLGSCNFQGATVIGDIRGSDVLDCDLRGGADLSQAQTYGCIWTGCLVDDTTIFPADSGGLQMIVTLERVRRCIPQLPQAYRQRARDILQALKEGRFLDNQAIIRDVLSTAKGRQVAQQLLDLLAAYPGAVERVKAIFAFAAASACENPRSVVTVDWFDGTVVTIDRDNLPPLPRPDDRYELDQWILAQAGPSPDLIHGRNVYTASIRPSLSIFIVSQADDWLWCLPRQGY